MWSTHEPESHLRYDLIRFRCLLACCLEANSVNIKRDHVSCQWPSKRNEKQKSHQTFTRNYLYCAIFNRTSTWAQFTSASVVVVVKERKKERKLWVLISGMGNCLKEKKCIRNLEATSSRWISSEWTKTVSFDYRDHAIVIMMYNVVIAFIVFLLFMTSNQPLTPSMQASIAEPFILFCSTCERF